MEHHIEKFIEPIRGDQNHRYKSWEHCFSAFKKQEESDDILALHLGFYLASWGMYRGSSGLLWKDYKIHIKPINILKNHFDIRFDNFDNIPSITDVFSLISELKAYYSNENYIKDLVKIPISATDTLISKILLGTLGCLPAFDRYFNLGFWGAGNSTINTKSLKQIWDKTNEMKPQIESIQQSINEETGLWYPPMKIIDMYYWQKGFGLQNEINKKN